jgi:uncharacterized protein (DUF697 family)
MNLDRKTMSLASLLGMIGALSGCATTGKSVGAGATVGALGGAGVGALADPGRHGAYRFRNVVIGTAVGAAVGAGAGFMADRFVHDEREEANKAAKDEAVRDAETHAASSTGQEPELRPARTEARWVPNQVRGQVFIPGHFEYIILEGARWETGK